MIYVKRFSLFKKRENVLTFQKRGRISLKSPKKEGKSFLGECRAVLTRASLF